MLLAQVWLRVYRQKIHCPHEAADQLIPGFVPLPAQVLDHLDYSAGVFEELLVDCLTQPAFPFNIFGSVFIIEIRTVKAQQLALAANTEPGAFFFNEREPLLAA